MRIKVASIFVDESDESAGVLYREVGVGYAP